jgi:hypothetical protein
MHRPAIVTRKNNLELNSASCDDLINLHLPSAAKHKFSLSDIDKTFGDRRQKYRKKTLVVEALAVRASSAAAAPSRMLADSVRIRARTSSCVLSAFPPVSIAIVSRLHSLNPLFIGARFVRVLENGLQCDRGLIVPREMMIPPTVSYRRNKA